MKNIEDYTNEEWLEKNFDRLRKEQISLINSELKFWRNELIKVLDNQTELLVFDRTTPTEVIVPKQTYTRGFGLMGLQSCMGSMITTTYEPEIQNLLPQERHVRSKINYYKNLLQWWIDNTSYQVFKNTRESRRRANEKIEEDNRWNERKIRFIGLISMLIGLLVISIPLIIIYSC